MHLVNVAPHHGWALAPIGFSKTVDRNAAGIWQLPAFCALYYFLSNNLFHCACFVSFNASRPSNERVESNKERLFFFIGLLNEIR